MIGADPEKMIRLDSRSDLLTDVGEARQSHPGRQREGAQTLLSRITPLVPTAAESEKLEGRSNTRGRSDLLEDAGEATKEGAGRRREPQERAALPPLIGSGTDAEKFGHHADSYLDDFHEDGAVASKERAGKRKEAKRPKAEVQQDLKLEAQRLMAAAEKLQPGSVSDYDAKAADLPADQAGRRKLRRNDSFAMDRMGGREKGHKDRPERRGGGGLVGRALARTVMTIMTNPLDDAETRAAQAEKVVHGLFGHRDHDREEERAERLAQSGTEKTRAGRIRKAAAGDDAEGEAELGGLAKTKQAIKARRLGKMLAGMGGGDKQGQKLGAELRGAELRSYLAEKQIKREGKGGKNNRFSCNVQDTRLAELRGQMDEDALDELADREGEKEGAGRHRKRQQGGDDGGGGLRRTKQGMVARRLAKIMGGASAEASEKPGLLGKGSSNLKQWMGALNKISAVNKMGGSNKGLMTLRRQASSFKMRSAALESNKVQTDLRKKADEQYETDKHAALTMTSAMTRRQLLTHQREGLQIFVDGHAGTLLEPPRRSIFARLFFRAPTAFTVQFEHKNVPIQMELLLRDTRSHTNSGRLPKPFMLKSDVDCIDRAYKEATLAADRAAVDVLVKLEGIDVEEEYYSPRERQSTDKARGTRASLIKTTRFAKDGGDQPQRNQKRHSISAPPTNRRSCAEGSTGAPSTTKPIPLWRKSSSGRILSGGDKGGSQSSAPATLQRRTSSFKMRNLKKLEEKIQGALASRVNKMADRSEKVGEVREKVKEAARAAPIVKTLKDGSMTQRGGGVTNRGGPTTSRGVPAITSRVGSSKQLTSRVGSPKPLRKRTSLERIFCGGSGKALTEAPPPPPQAKPGTALPAPGRLPPPSASFAPAQQSCLKRRAADGGGQSTSTPVPPLSGMPAPAPMPPPRSVVSPERRTTQTVGSAVAARQSAPRS